MTRAEASVLNGETLCYDANFVIELAALMLDKDEAMEKLKNLSEKTGGTATDFLASRLEEPLNFPAKKSEAYDRALSLVEAIGRAVGEELSRRDFMGEIEPYYLTFFQGMKSRRKPEDVSGSSLEKLFFMCGQESINIVATSAYRNTRVSNKGLRELLARTLAAFSEGVKECRV
jgi:hypothetical protein